MTKTSTLIEIRAELLSMIAKADGTVKDIENSAAEAILNDSGSLNEVFAKELYHWSVQTDVENDEQEDIVDRLKDLELEEKVALVRALWAVAASDGEIHPAELSTINDMMNAMGVDHNMVSNTPIKS